MSNRTVRRRVDFLVLGSPGIEADEIQEVVDSLPSGWLGTGTKVAGFEADFGRNKGARYTATANSCTASLERSVQLDIALLFNRADHRREPLPNGACGVAGASGPGGTLDHLLAIPGQHEASSAKNGCRRVDPSDRQGAAPGRSARLGTCLRTDWKPTLADLCEPESEVLTYRHAGECVERARWLLGHPTECEKIAQARQKWTLKDHAFSARAAALDSAFRACLGQR